MATLEDSKDKAEESAPDMLYGLIYKQMETVTGLSIRVTVLERLLLSKGLLDQQEIVDGLKAATEEFTQLMQSALAQKH